VVHSVAQATSRRAFPAPRAAAMTCLTAAQPKKVGSPLATSREIYSPRATSLNVLPSRQNIFIDGSPHPHGIVPSSGHLAPCLVDSLASPLLRAATPTPEVPSRKGTLDLDKDTVELTPVSDEDALSWREAVFNLANTVLGVGVLSVPFAFRLSGYSSLGIVLVVIAITALTANFIGAALVLAERSPVAQAVPRRGRDFAFLAHVAFGPVGRAIIGAITCLEIWFALVTFMVMSGVNINIAFPAVDKGVAVIFSCLFSGMLVFLPMRIFSYLSLASSLSLVVAMGAMVTAALTMFAWANPYDHIGKPALIRPENIPRSVGIIVFCFAGHPCFPIVHECMKDRSQWRLSIAATFFLALVYYGGLGVFGYLVFGTALEASLTQNVAQLRNALLCRTISAVAFVVKLQLTTPLLMNAILVSCWAPAAGAPEWPPGRMVALGALIAATAVTAVFFADNVAAVASLTGSLFTMATSVLFPTIVHWRLRQIFEEKMNSASIATHAVVVAFGTVMAILGTALAVQDMSK